MIKSVEFYKASKLLINLRIFWQKIRAMRRNLWIVGCLAGLLSLGFYVKQTKTAQASLTGLSLTKEKSELAKLGGEQRKARLQRGDTLVLEQEQLASLLPKSLVDYQAKGKPNSSVVNMMGDRYTVVEQVYFKDNQQIKLSIADYNAAYTLYNIATALVEAGVTLDTDEQQWQEIHLGMNEVKSWEMYDKQAKRNVITISIAERFIVTLEASEQKSAEQVKEVLKELQLQNLC